MADEIDIRSGALVPRGERLSRGGAGEQARRWLRGGEGKGQRYDVTVSEGRVYLNGNLAPSLRLVSRSDPGIDGNAAGEASKRGEEFFLAEVNPATQVQKRVLMGLVSKGDGTFLNVPGIGGGEDLLRGMGDLMGGRMKQMAGGVANMFSSFGRGLMESGAEQHAEGQERGTFGAAVERERGDLATPAQALRSAIETSPLMPTLMGLGRAARPLLGRGQKDAPEGRDLATERSAMLTAGAIGSGESRAQIVQEAEQQAQAQWEHDAALAEARGLPAPEKPEARVPSRAYSAGAGLASAGLAKIAPSGVQRMLTGQLGARGGAKGALGLPRAAVSAKDFGAYEGATEGMEELSQELASQATGMNERGLSMRDALELVAAASMSGTAVGGATQVVASGGIKMFGLAGEALLAAKRRLRKPGTPPAGAPPPAAEPGPDAAGGPEGGVPAPEVGPDTSLEGGAPLAGAGVTEVSEPASLGPFDPDLETGSAGPAEVLARGPVAQMAHDNIAAASGVESAKAETERELAESRIPPKAARTMADEMIESAMRLRDAAGSIEAAAQKLGEVGTADQWRTLTGLEHSDQGWEKDRENMLRVVLPHVRDHTHPEFERAYQVVQAYKSDPGNRPDSDASPSMDAARVLYSLAHDRMREGESVERAIVRLSNEGDAGGVARMLAYLESGVTNMRRGEAAARAAPFLVLEVLAQNPDATPREVVGTVLDRLVDEDGQFRQDAMLGAFERGGLHNLFMSLEGPYGDAYRAEMAKVPPEQQGFMQGEVLARVSQGALAGVSAPATETKGETWRRHARAAMSARDRMNERMEVLMRTGSGRDGAQYMSSIGDDDLGRMALDPSEAVESWRQNVKARAAGWLGLYKAITFNGLREYREGIPPEVADQEGDGLYVKLAARLVGLPGVAEAMDDLRMPASREHRIESIMPLMPVFADVLQLKAIGQERTKHPVVDTGSHVERELREGARPRRKTPTNVSAAARAWEAAQGTEHADSSFTALTLAVRDALGERGTLPLSAVPEEALSPIVAAMAREDGLETEVHPTATDPGDRVFGAAAEPAPDEGDTQWTLFRGEVVDNSGNRNRSREGGWLRVRTGKGQYFDTPMSVVSSLHSAKAEPPADGSPAPAPPTGIGFTSQLQARLDAMREIPRDKPKEKAKPGPKPKGKAPPDPEKEAKKAADKMAREERKLGEEADKLARKRTRTEEARLKREAKEKEKAERKAKRAADKAERDAKKAEEARQKAEKKAAAAKAKSDPKGALEEERRAAAEVQAMIDEQEAVGDGDTEIAGQMREMLDRHKASIARLEKRVAEDAAKAERKAEREQKAALAEEEQQLKDSLAASVESAEARMASLAQLRQERLKDGAPQFDITDAYQQSVSYELSESRKQLDRWGKESTRKQIHRDVLNKLAVAAKGMDSIERTLAQAMGQERIDEAAETLRAAEAKVSAEREAARLAEQEKRDGSKELKNLLASAGRLVRKALEAPGKVPSAEAKAAADAATKAVDEVKAEADKAEGKPAAKEKEEDTGARGDFAERDRRLWSRLSKEHDASNVHYQQGGPNPELLELHAMLRDADETLSEISALEKPPKELTERHKGQMRAIEKARKAYQKTPQAGLKVSGATSEPRGILSRINRYRDALPDALAVDLDHLYDQPRARFLADEIVAAHEMLVGQEGEEVALGDDSPAVPARGLFRRKAGKMRAKARKMSDLAGQIRDAVTEEDVDGAVRARRAAPLIEEHRKVALSLDDELDTREDDGTVDLSGYLRDDEAEPEPERRGPTARERIDRDFAPIFADFARMSSALRDGPDQAHADRYVMLRDMLEDIDADVESGDDTSARTEDLVAARRALQDAGDLIERLGGPGKTEDFAKQVSDAMARVAAPLGFGIVAADRVAALGDVLTARYEIRKIEGEGGPFPILNSRFTPLEERLRRVDAAASAIESAGRHHSELARAAGKVGALRDRIKLYIGRADRTEQREREDGKEAGAGALAKELRKEDPDSPTQKGGVDKAAAVGADKPPRMSREDWLKTEAGKARQQFFNDWTRFKGMMRTAEKALSQKASAAEARAARPRADERKALSSRTDSDFAAIKPRAQKVISELARVPHMRDMAVHLNRRLSSLIEMGKALSDPARVGEADLEKFERRWEWAHGEAADMLDQAEMLAAHAEQTGDPGTLAAEADKPWPKGDAEVRARALTEFFLLLRGLDKAIEEADSDGAVRDAAMTADVVAISDSKGDEETDAAGQEKVRYLVRPTWKNQEQKTRLETAARALSLQRKVRRLWKHSLRKRPERFEEEAVELIGQGKEFLEIREGWLATGLRPPTRTEEARSKGKKLRARERRGTVTTSTADVTTFDDAGNVTGTKTVTKKIGRKGEVLQETEERQEAPQVPDEMADDDAEFETREDAKVDDSSEAIREFIDKLESQEAKDWFRSLTPDEQLTAFRMMVARRRDLGKVDLGVLMRGKGTLRYVRALAEKVRGHIDALEKSTLDLVEGKPTISQADAEAGKRGVPENMMAQFRRGMGQVHANLFGVSLLGDERVAAASEEASDRADEAAKAAKEKAENATGKAKAEAEEDAAKAEKAAEEAARKAADDKDRWLQAAAGGRVWDMGFGVHWGFVVVAASAAVQIRRALGVDETPVWEAIDDVGAKFDPRPEQPSREEIALLKARKEDKPFIASAADRRARKGDEARTAREQRAKERKEARAAEKARKAEADKESDPDLVVGDMPPRDEGKKADTGEEVDPEFETVENYADPDDPKGRPRLDQMTEDQLARERSQLRAFIKSRRLAQGRHAQWIRKAAETWTGFDAILGGLDKAFKRLREREGGVDRFAYSYMREIEAKAEEDIAEIDELLKEGNDLMRKRMEFPERDTQAKRKAGEAVAQGRLVKHDPMAGYEAEMEKRKPKPRQKREEPEKLHEWELTEREKSTVRANTEKILDLAIHDLMGPDATVADVVKIRDRVRRVLENPLEMALTEDDPVRKARLYDMATAIARRWLKERKAVAAREERREYDRARDAADKQISLHGQLVEQVGMVRAGITDGVKPDVSAFVMSHTAEEVDALLELRARSVRAVEAQRDLFHSKLEERIAKRLKKAEEEADEIVSVAEETRDLIVAKMTAEQSQEYRHPTTREGKIERREELREHLMDARDRQSKAAKDLGQQIDRLEADIEQARGQTKDNRALEKSRKEFEGRVESLTREFNEARTTIEDLQNRIEDMPASTRDGRPNPKREGLIDELEAAKKSEESVYEELAEAKRERERLAAGKSEYEARPTKQIEAELAEARAELEEQLEYYRALVKDLEDGFHRLDNALTEEERMLADAIDLWNERFLIHKTATGKRVVKVRTRAEIDEATTKLPPSFLGSKHEADIKAVVEGTWMLHGLSPDEQHKRRVAEIEEGIERHRKEGNKGLADMVEGQLRQVGANPLDFGLIENYDRLVRSVRSGNAVQLARSAWAERRATKAGETWEPEGVGLTRKAAEFVDWFFKESQRTRITMVADGVWDSRTPAHIRDAQMFLVGKRRYMTMRDLTATESWQIQEFLNSVIFSPKDTEKLRFIRKLSLIDEGSESSRLDIYRKQVKMLFNQGRITDIAKVLRHARKKDRAAAYAAQKKLTERLEKMGIEEILELLYKKVKAEGRQFEYLEVLKRRIYTAHSMFMRSVKRHQESVLSMPRGKRGEVGSVTDEATGKELTEEEARERELARMWLAREETLMGLVRGRNTAMNILDEQMGRYLDNLNMTDHELIGERVDDEAMDRRIEELASQAKAEATGEDTEVRDAEATTAAEDQPAKAETVTEEAKRKKAGGKKAKAEPEPETPAPGETEASPETRQLVAEILALEQMAKEAEDAEDGDLVAELSVELREKMAALRRLQAKEAKAKDDGERQEAPRVPDELMQTSGQRRREREDTSPATTTMVYDYAVTISTMLEEIKKKTKGKDWTPDIFRIERELSRHIRAAANSGRRPTAALRLSATDAGRLHFLLNNNIVDIKAQKARIPRSYNERTAQNVVDRLGQIAGPHATRTDATKAATGQEVARREEFSPVSLTLDIDAPRVQRVLRSKTMRPGLDRLVRPLDGTTTESVRTKPMRRKGHRYYTHRRAVPEVILVTRENDGTYVVTGSRMPQEGRLFKRLSGAEAANVVVAAFVHAGFNERVSTDNLLVGDWVAGGFARVVTRRKGVRAETAPPSKVPGLPDHVGKLAGEGFSLVGDESVLPGLPGVRVIGESKTGMIVRNNEGETVMVSRKEFDALGEAAGTAMLADVDGESVEAEHRGDYGLLARDREGKPYLTRAAVDRMMRERPILSEADIKELYRRAREAKSVMEHNELWEKANRAENVRQQAERALLDAGVMYHTGEFVVEDKVFEPETEFVTSGQVVALYPDRRQVMVRAGFGRHFMLNTNGVVYRHRHTAKRVVDSMGDIEGARESRFSARFVHPLNVFKEYGRRLGIVTAPMTPDTAKQQGIDSGRYLALVKEVGDTYSVRRVNGPASSAASRRVLPNGFVVLVMPVSENRARMLSEVVEKSWSHEELEGKRNQGLPQVFRASAEMDPSEIMYDLASDRGYQDNVREVGDLVEGEDILAVHMVDGLAPGDMTGTYEVVEGTVIEIRKEPAVDGENVVIDVMTPTGMREIDASSLVTGAVVVDPKSERQLMPRDTGRSPSYRRAADDARDRMAEMEDAGPLPWQGPSAEENVTAVLSGVADRVGKSRREVGAHPERRFLGSDWVRLDTRGKGKTDTDNESILKVLVAGLDKGSRGHVERFVRQALHGATGKGAEISPLTFEEAGRFVNEHIQDVMYDRAGALDTQRARLREFLMDRMSEVLVAVERSPSMASHVIPQIGGLAYWLFVTDPSHTFRNREEFVAQARAEMFDEELTRITREVNRLGMETRSYSEGTPGYVFATDITGRLHASARSGSPFMHREWCMLAALRSGTGDSVRNIYEKMRALNELEGDPSDLVRSVKHSDGKLLMSTMGFERVNMRELGLDLDERSPQVRDLVPLFRSGHTFAVSTPGHIFVVKDGVVRNMGGHPTTTVLDLHILRWPSRRDIPESAPVGKKEEPDMAKEEMKGLHDRNPQEVALLADLFSEKVLGAIDYADTIRDLHDDRARSDAEFHDQAIDSLVEAGVVAHSLGLDGVPEVSQFIFTVNHAANLHDDHRFSTDAAVDAQAVTDAVAAATRAGVELWDLRPALKKESMRARLELKRQGRKPDPGRYADVMREVTERTEEAARWRKEFLRR